MISRLNGGFFRLRNNRFKGALLHSQKESLPLISSSSEGLRISRNIVPSGVSVQ